MIVRTKIARTNGSGRVFFWPSVHDMHLLQDWQGFSLRLTDPQNDFAVPCGPDLGPGLNEVHPDQVVSNAAGMKGYFPVVLVEPTNTLRNHLGWSATARPIGFPLNLYIPVIPLLAQLDDCQRAQDASLTEDCRLLNAEAKASEMQSENTSLSAFAAAQRVPRFWANNSLTAAVPVRRPEDLFPAIVAGVPRTEASMYDNGTLGTGRRAYSCAYTRQGDAPAYISAQVEEFPDPQGAKRRLVELPGGFADHAPETDTEEQFAPGQKIERHHGLQYSGAFWLSGGRVILITFNQPFAKEDEFIATFLERFPSSL